MDEVTVEKLDSDGNVVESVQLDLKGEPPLTWRDINALVGQANNGLDRAWGD